MKKNIQLCIDLKTFLVEDSLPLLGKGYHGVLNQQGDELVCFVEEEAAKRGPHNKPIYKGSYIAVSYSERLGHYWWRLISENMSRANATDLAKELQLAKKAVTKHKKTFGLVEKR